MQEGIHPEWYPDAEIVVDGEVVMRVGSTKKRIAVDIWSGTHPFFTGETRLVDTEGQVDRFMRRLQVRQQKAAEREARKVKRNPRKAEIGLVGLDKRAENALVEAGYTTAGDLADAIAESDDVLLAVPGIGQTALIAVRRYLRNEGLIG